MATTYAQPAAFNALHGPPSSPPPTPSTQSYQKFPSQPLHPSIRGHYNPNMSPPLEFIEPIGNGPQFHFTRPQPRDINSRPSTASGLAGSSNARRSKDDDDNFSESEIERPLRRVDHADFVLEELDSETDYDSETEVVRPYQYEDAVSEKAAEKLEHSGFLDKFSELHCKEHSSDEEDEQQRNYRRKKKRWSAGIFKRTHSQSVGSDSDDDGPLDAHDVGSSARRLRRRVRGPEDRRASLIFEDMGFPNIRHIVEVEEPDEGGFGRGPPSIPSDDGFTLDELPFWVVEEAMDVEGESS